MGKLTKAQERRLREAPVEWSVMPILGDFRSFAPLRREGMIEVREIVVEGTFTRISAVLRDGEDRTDFVRTAVEREIDAREREARRLAKADKAD